MSSTAPVFRTGDLITARGLVTMAEAHTALPADGLRTLGGRCVHLVTQTGTGPPVVLARRFVECPAMTGIG